MKAHNMAEIVVVAVLAMVACGISHVRLSMYANETARQHIIDAKMQRHAKRSEFIESQHPKAHTVFGDEQ